MASFLRSFATGFVSAANVQFDEKRKAQIAKDLEYTKTFVSKHMPAYSVAQVNAAKTNKTAADSLELLGPVLGPGGNLAQAQVAAGTLKAGDIAEYLQNIPAEARQKLIDDPFQYTPPQAGTADLQTFLLSRGMPQKQIDRIIKERDIDLSKFTGTPDIGGLLTGGPEELTIGDTLPPIGSGSEQTTKVVTKQNPHIRNAVQKWFADTGIFQLVATPEGGTTFKLVLPVGKKGIALAKRQLSEVIEVERRVESRVNAVIQAAEKAGQEISTIDFNQIVSDVVKEVNPARWHDLQFTPEKTSLKDKKTTLEDTATGAFTKSSKTEVTIPLPPQPVTKEEVDVVIKKLEAAPDEDAAVKILIDLLENDPKLFGKVNERLELKQ